MKNTIKILSWIWIFSLFVSPIIGLYSILFLSCIEIGTNIDWDASFTGKQIK